MKTVSYQDQEDQIMAFTDLLLMQYVVVFWLACEVLVPARPLDLTHDFKVWIDEIVSKNSRENVTQFYPLVYLYKLLSP